ncbi:MAG: HEAT repeat domain-containing protein, partial [Acidobacteria bacterium]|nr:HEAT repeat domain-containing protein [Acidobacteriota bacterium]
AMVRADSRRHSSGVPCVLLIARALVVRVCLAAGLGAAVGAAGACAGGPSPVLPVAPTTDQKLATILRFEDRRIVGDAPADPGGLPGAASGSRSEAAAAGADSPPRRQPQLIAYLDDPSSRIRRRAALALGRVGLAEAVEPLARRVGADEPEAEVRLMAAFALGLIGDPAAAAPLRLALEDPSPRVRGRAAEALGRVGDETAAGAIGAVVEAYRSAAFDIDPEDVSFPQPDEVEAFRLAVYALVGLGAYEPLAEAILFEDGQPILWWWPVAYALQAIEDPRAFDALTTLANIRGSIGVAFAARGLGALGDPRAVETLAGLLDRDRRDGRVVVSAVRALGAIDDAAAAAALDRFVRIRSLDPMLRLEAVDALASHGNAASVPVFTELMTHSWAPLRAASLRALAAADPAAFLRMLSGLGPDPDWRVRRAVADAMRQVDPEAAAARLTAMLDDPDERVLPNVLEALAAVGAPSAGATLTACLRASDVVVRRTAARLLGELRPPAGEAALAEAYRAGLSDPSYLARAAVLRALAAYGLPAAGETLHAALDDPDWAVRVVAAELLADLAPGGGDYARAIRPAPAAGTDYGAPDLVAPPVSPHVYIETDRGTIQIELAVLDAPLTADNFMRLARRGFYDGLSFHRVVPNYVVQGGDPRHDSEGGPGYTLRDELNELPYLRGTVGMALDWRDTGGSQFFITHSPQPHLDGRYTAFGRVVAGMEVVDAMLPGDRIRRILVWDGRQPPGQRPAGGV